MAYGYERGFIIEKDPTLRKCINCKDCLNCNNEDFSCSIKGYYFPTDGYKHWKNCENFCVSLKMDNAEHKLEQIAKCRFIPVVLTETIEFERKSKTDSASARGRLKYQDISEFYLNLFEKASIYDRIALAKLCQIVPKEMYVGFMRYAAHNDDLIYKKSLVVYLKRIGLKTISSSNVTYFKKDIEKNLIISALNYINYGKLIDENEFSRVFSSAVISLLEARNVIGNY